MRRAFGPDRHHCSPLHRTDPRPGQRIRGRVGATRRPTKTTATRQARPDNWISPPSAAYRPATSASSRLGGPSPAGTWSCASPRSWRCRCATGTPCSSRPVTRRRTGNGRWKTLRWLRSAGPSISSCGAICRSRPSSTAGRTSFGPTPPPAAAAAQARGGRRGRAARAAGRGVRGVSVPRGRARAGPVRRRRCARAAPQGRSGAELLQHHRHFRNRRRPDRRRAVTGDFLPGRCPDHGLPHGRRSRACPCPCH